LQKKGLWTTHGIPATELTSLCEASPKTHATPPSAHR
jgi:hypothetical protein